MSDRRTAIHTKEAFILFLLASFSSAVRLTAGLSAKIGKQAGWVSIFWACGVYCGLILLLAQLFKKRESSSLFEVYELALGRPISKILGVVCIVWLFIITSMHVRMFAERFAASLLSTTPTELFILSILAVCFIFLSGPINHFVRLCRILFLVVFFSLVAIFLAQLPQMKLSNVFPVTTLDTVATLKASYIYMGFFGYITYPLLFGDEIVGKETLRSTGLKSALVLLAANQFVFFVTIGVFGHKMTQNLIMPFVMSIKTISLFGSIERLESMTILLWVITDIAMMIMLMYTALRLVEKVFKVKSAMRLKSPLILGVFLLAIVFETTMAEVQEFSGKIGRFVDIFLGMLVPVIVFIVLKIRRRGALTNSKNQPEREALKG